MRRLCVTLVRRLCDGYLPKAAEARYVNGGPSSHCIVCCIIAAAAPRRAWPQLHARAHVCVHTSTLVRAYTYRLLVSCSMQEPSVFSFIISQFLSTFTGDLQPPAHETWRACGEAVVAAQSSTCTRLLLQSHTTMRPSPSMATPLGFVMLMLRT